MLEVMVLGGRRPSHGLHHIRSRCGRRRREEQREKSNAKRDSKGRRMRELETGSMGRAM